MKIYTGHQLVHAEDAGNGYHGNCRWCGMVLETDLGYCSWDRFRCVEHEVEKPGDLPMRHISYIRYHGLKWNEETRKFSKPYSDREFTIDELDEYIRSIKEIE
jgi:hypothetical protein